MTNNTTTSIYKHTDYRLSYQHDFGIFTLAIQTLTMLTSLYILYTRSRLPPLNTRSIVLYSMISLGTTLASFTSIIDIYGGDIIPCRLYYWIYATYYMWLAGPLLLTAWRLYRMHGFEQLKREYKYGKVKLNINQINRLKQYQRWHSEKMLLLVQITQSTMFSIIFLGIYIQDKYYNTSNYGCQLQPYLDHHVDALNLCWFILAIIYAPIAIWLVYKLLVIQYTSKTGGDSIGLANELWLSIVLILGGFFSLIICQYTDYSDYMYKFNYIYTCSIQFTIYQILHMIYPSLYNTEQSRKFRHWYRRILFNKVSITINDNNNETELLHILTNELGFSYMLQQCKSEFCEETLQCLKAIWLYNNKPTYAKMLQIHNMYIDEYSPFQVNISSMIRNNVTDKICSIQPECSVIEIKEIFSSVENELTNLLLNNSYIRFKRSTRYKDYCNGVQLNLSYDTDEITTNTSTLGGNEDGNLILLTSQSQHNNLSLDIINTAIYSNRSTINNNHNRSKTNTYDNSSITTMPIAARQITTHSYSIHINDTIDRDVIRTTNNRTSHNRAKSTRVSCNNNNTSNNDNDTLDDFTMRLCNPGKHTLNTAHSSISPHSISRHRHNTSTLLQNHHNHHQQHNNSNHDSTLITPVRKTITNIHSMIPLVDTTPNSRCSIETSSNSNRPSNEQDHDNNARGISTTFKISTDHDHSVNTSG